MHSYYAHNALQPSVHLQRICTETLAHVAGTGFTLGKITIDFEDDLVLCGVATEAPEGVPLGIGGGEVQQRVLVLLCAHRQGNVAHTRM